MRIDRPLVLLMLGTTAATLAAYGVYSRGISGGFVFDDWASLPALGSQGPINGLASFWRYITSGTADPTGRPISLLSFLADGHDWPTSPLPFKRTNILLHLINGILLTALLWRLGGVLGIERKRSAIAAWFGGSFWLLHPLLVSTVLYIVQREAMLAATLALLGLHTWLGARQRFKEDRWGGVLIALIVPIFTVLAFLAKANGVLLPLLIAVIEACLPTVEKDAGRYRRWLTVACAPWIVAILAGLIWYGVHGVANASPATRGWSISQRLITEPSILWLYLCQLGLVIPSAGSVFHDQYAAAAGWLSPWWTLPALVACLATIALAWCFRRRYPPFSLAILFFFAGHLLESTSLPLELYFDHRNYLPSLLLFWPIGLALGGLRSRSVGIAASASLVTGAAILAADLSSLWGDPIVQAITWAVESPESARAQAYAAQMDAAGGHLERATNGLQEKLADFGSEPQIALTMISLRCELGSVRQSDLDFARKSLTSAPRDPGKLLLNWIIGELSSARTRPCQGLDNVAISTILDAAESNARISSLPGRMQDIEHARGAIAIATGNTLAARRHFDTALAFNPSPEVALEQAAILGRAGAPCLALGHLDLLAALPRLTPRGPSAGMAWIHDRVLEHQHYWENEFTSLRATLVAEEHCHAD